MKEKEENTERERAIDREKEDQREKVSYFESFSDSAVVCNVLC